MRRIQPSPDRRGPGGLGTWFSSAVRGSPLYFNNETQSGGTSFFWLNLTSRPGPTRVIPGRAPGCPGAAAAIDENEVAAMFFSFQPTGEWGSPCASELVVTGHEHVSVGSWVHTTLWTLNGLQFTNVVDTPQPTNVYPDMLDALECSVCLHRSSTQRPIQRSTIHIRVRRQSVPVAHVRAVEMVLQSANWHEQQCMRMFGLQCVACGVGQTCSQGRCVSTCAATCSGCCDTNNQCQAGASGAACGSANSVCVACAAQESCVTGRCARAAGVAHREPQCAVRCACSTSEAAHRALSRRVPAGAEQLRWVEWCACRCRWAGPVDRRGDDQFSVAGLLVRCADV